MDSAIIGLQEDR